MSMDRFGGVWEVAGQKHGDIRLAIDSVLSVDGEELRFTRVAARQDAAAGTRDIMQVRRLGKQSLYEEPEEVVERYYSGGFDIVEEMRRRSDDLLWVRARAIDANKVNENGDFFPYEEFTKLQAAAKDDESERIPAYKTFEGCRVYTNHKNDDVEKSKGEVVFAELDDENKCIWCTFYVDAAAYPQLARGIREGYITDVSMGCQVQWSECSVCDHKAKSEKEWCDHLKSHKGKRWSGKVTSGRREGQKVSDELVHEINHDIKFIELSVVGDGAFKECEIEAILPHTEVIGYANTLKETATKLDRMIDAGITVVGERDAMPTVYDVERFAALRQTQELLRTASSLSGEVMKRDAQAAASAMPPMASVGNVLDTLNAVLNKLEAIVVNLLQRKDQIDLKHVQNISKSMAELQETMSDMIDDGIGAEPTMAGPAGMGAAPAAPAPEQPAPPGQPGAEGQQPAAQDYTPAGQVGSMMAPQGFAAQPAAAMSDKPYQVSLLPNVIPGAISAISDRDGLHVLSERVSGLLREIESAVGGEACAEPGAAKRATAEGGRTMAQPGSIYDYTATNLMRKMAAKVRQQTEVATDDERHRIAICSDGTVLATQDGQATDWNALARLTEDDIRDIRDEKVHVVAQRLLDQFVRDANTGRVALAAVEPYQPGLKTREQELQSKRTGNPTEVQEVQVEKVRDGNPEDVQEVQIQKVRDGNPEEVQEVQVEELRAGNPKDTQEQQLTDSRKGNDVTVTEVRLESRRSEVSSPDRIVSATLNGLAYAVCDSYTSPSDVLDAVVRIASKPDQFTPKIVSAANEDSYRGRRTVREQMQIGLRTAQASSPDDAIVDRMADVLVESPEIEVEDVVDVLKTVASEPIDRMRTIVTKRVQKFASEIGVTPMPRAAQPDRSQALRGALYAEIVKDADEPLDVESVQAAMQAIADVAYASSKTPPEVFKEISAMEDGKSVAEIEAAKTPEAVEDRKRSREAEAYWAAIDMTKAASVRHNPTIVEALADRSIQTGSSSSKIWKAAKKLAEGKRQAHQLVTRAIADRVTGDMDREAIDMTARSEQTYTIHLCREDVGDMEPSTDGYEDAVREAAIGFLQDKGFQVDPGTFAFTDLDIGEDGMIVATVRSSVTKRITGDRAAGMVGEITEPAPGPEESMAGGFESGFGPDRPLMTPTAVAKRKERREAMLRAAQGMPMPPGPGGPGGAPGGAPGGEPPMPGAEGGPGLASLTGGEPPMGESPESDLDKTPTPGETKPIGTICPSCGSTDVELAGGDGECKGCGAKYRVRLVIDDIVVPDTEKATAGPAETEMGGEEEMPEGLGAATAPATGPMAGPPPGAGGMPPMPMPMAASIEWYTGPEQFVKVAELKHSGVPNADIPGPKPGGMVCVSCGNHDVKTVDGKCHCTACNTISTVSVQPSKKHAGYLLNSVRVLLGS